MQAQIDDYTRRGYRLVTQTETTAQLIKPKQFSCIVATLAFLLFGVGLLIYLFIYMADKDQMVYLRVEVERVIVTKNY